MVAHIRERLAEEACRSARRVIDGLADSGVNDLDDCADKRTRGVVFSTVTSGVAHTTNLVLIEDGHLVAILRRLEREGVHLIDNLAEVETAIDLVAELGEDLAYLILEGIGRGGDILIVLERREEFDVYEIYQVVTREGVDEI